MSASKLGWKQIDPGVRRMVRAEADEHPAWADKKNLWALLLILDGKYAEALDALDRCLSINPRYAWAHANRVQTLGLLGRGTEARTDLAAGPELDHELPALLEAYLDLLDGETRRGLDVLGRLPEDHSDFMHTCRLREALRFSVDEDRARKNWEALERGFCEASAVDVAPWEPSGEIRQPSLVFGLHQLFLMASTTEGRLGRTERSEASACLAYAYWSDRGTLLNQQGSLAALRGENDRAESLYREAARVSPGAPRVHISLAYHWSAMGEREPAQDALERALDLAPRYADLHYQMGLLRRGGSDLMGALRSHREALRINPDYTLARLEEAELLFVLERWEEAKAAYRKVLDTGLKSSDMYLRLGQIEDHLGHPEYALDAFERALRLNPEDPLAHYYMGKLHQNRGDREHAVQSWKRFIALNEERQQSGTTEDPTEDDS